MTIRLRLPASSAELASFTCSPAAEALRSLHVLYDAKSHPLHISWILKARERMGAELRAEADLFAFWYADRPLMFREIWPTPAPWKDELAALQQAPIADFAEQLIHAALAHRGRAARVRLAAFQADTQLQEQALAAVQARHPASLPALETLIHNPERLRSRLATFLAHYWEACIAPDWPSLERHLLDDIARHSRTYARHGLSRMLEELSPHIHVAPDETLVIRPPATKDVDPLELDLVNQDQITLVPSHFVWPELTATVQRDLQAAGERKTVTITYALEKMQHEARPPAPPEDLLKLLRSAGDPTRLQILHLLGRRPRSTREVAGLIGLTEAAISKHLKLLQEAGWIEPERRGYYVYYRPVQDSRARLTQAIDHLLGD